ncbi:MAG: ABC transporter substrate-binding protein [Candidatus Adiutricales bacterium]
MKPVKKMYFLIISFCFIWMLGAGLALAADMPHFDINKMSDMSDYDPNTVKQPTGDTIKFAIVASFSGPAATVSEFYWNVINWVAYDLNKRGGIMVDGKKKLIKVLKADHASKPAIAKKVTERMILKEKVKLLWGTNGSNNSKIISQVAKKYKVIYQDGSAMSDELMDGTNFNRYTFMTAITTGQVGAGLAAFYAKRKKETKFYILCQDYLFGHSMANGFKNALPKYFPEAQIVGEDYHKLFATDYAAYLTKIKASGAEVIYTGDWIPDAENMLKQARQMGVMLPMANMFLNDPNVLEAVGIEGTVGLVNLGPANIELDSYDKFYLQSVWHQQWKNKWQKPYNNPRYKWLAADGLAIVMQTYWLFDVVARAGTLDAEKIIEVWEGDKYRAVHGVLEMRPCDHKTIRDVFIAEYVYPNLWYEKSANAGKIITIPAKDAMPLKAADLERCKN